MTDEHHITLNDYQASNLKWCLRVIMENEPVMGIECKILDTGDWCGEILNMLESLPIEMEPNGR